MNHIVAAAIQFNGKAYIGYRHATIGHNMLRAGACKRPFPGGPAQGFFTSDGEFVSREEAMKIAKAAGQVGPEKKSSMLFSEDLWTPTGERANYES